MGAVYRIQKYGGRPPELVVHVVGLAVSRLRFGEISQLIHDWREIAPVLGLTQTDEENIIAGYSPNSVPVQRRTMLTTWRKRHGPAATYSRLANAFRQCGRQELVERVSVLVERREISLSTGELALLGHRRYSIISAWGFKDCVTGIRNCQSSPQKCITW